MAENEIIDQQFISHLTGIIETRYLEEDIRVSFLAEELGVSRATLHRKINAATNLSTSQFIRQIRLRKAKELLQNTALNVTEVAYKVGFNSAIYFSKCFHEFYGYPPGKVREQKEDDAEKVEPLKTKDGWKSTFIITTSTLVILLLLMLFYFKPFSINKNSLDYSIAVLPPTYIGTDSAYIHQLDGTIGMILDNLSLISGLEKVIPWTSVQKYRNSGKSASEIADELKVSYIVETNGMAIENTIRLNIKIIDGIRENQIWFDSYEVGTEEFIKLPINVAKNIANEINAEITQEEIIRINKMPTQNNLAWNYFLKGKEIYNTGISNYYGQGDAGNNLRLNHRNLFEDAISNFERALENDNEFALAYAQLAITYFMIDRGVNEGVFSEQIRNNADKAIMNDAKHDMSLIAKAYDYINSGENKLAIPYLERAVQYNPNSVVAYRLLANLYNLSREANTEKYLEYKLMTVKLNASETNVIQKSEDYRLAARALRVAGFYDEAEKYIEMSLGMNPVNFSSICEKGDILIERSGNYEEARNILVDALQIDSRNVEILRSLFTNHYLSEDYENAHRYFEKIKFIDQNLSFLAAKDYSRLAVICDRLGMTTESEGFLDIYKKTNRFNLNSYTNGIEMTRLYCLENKPQKALEKLSEFSQQQYHFIYTIRMLKDDPVFDNIRKLSEFNTILSDIETKFWNNNKEIRENLKDKRLF